MWLYIVGGTAGFFFVIRIIYTKFVAGECTSSTKLVGKTVIVTGASAGIGKETARDFAERGARVILACRNVEKANKVAYDIINSTGNGQVVVQELELSSLASVRKFAKHILETESSLHILVNNAGIGGARTKKITEDGLELTMATNHYGHFLLTNMLLGLLKKSAPSRIVNVSSEAHQLGNVANSFNVDDLRYEKEPFPSSFALYAHSKLANILFTRELSEKLRSTGVTTNVLHPGFVDTEIFAKKPSFLGYLFKGFAWLVAKDEKLGAQTTIYLAVSEEVKDISGEYFSDCKISKTSDLSKDAGLAKKFWEASEQMVKLTPEESHL